MESDNSSTLKYLVTFIVVVVLLAVAIPTGTSTSTFTEGWENFNTFLSSPFEWKGWHFSLLVLFAWTR